MKTAFFGTPAIAVPSLQALTEVSEVAIVVCQPDRPAGRGLRARACAVKERALELGLDVHQPTRVKTGTLHEALRERGVELAVVLAYGRILPAATLQAPRLGCVNLHASLLPKYRGAAPINWAIARGEVETGVTLMQMDEGLDTGPVLAEQRIELLPTWDAGHLAQQLGRVAAELLRASVPKLESGALRAVPQDPSAATYAPPITPQDTLLDFGKSAVDLHNWVRAFSPRPGCHTSAAGKRLKILETRLTQTPAQGAVPGTLFRQGGRLLVATGDGALELVRAQLEGKRALTAAELLNGRTLVEGQQLGR